MNQHFRALTQLQADVKARLEQERMEEIARRAFARGDSLDINALDPFDPVHVRNRSSLRDVDYDGDGGRGWIEDQEKDWGTS